MHESFYCRLCRASLRGGVHEGLEGVVGRLRQRRREVKLRRGKAMEAVNAMASAMMVIRTLSAKAAEFAM